MNPSYTTHPATPTTAPTQGLRARWNQLTDALVWLTPHSLLALAARFALAGIFWQSGRTKVEGWFTLTDSAHFLFREEYKLPLLPPELAAQMAATAEHVFLALLGMTLVIQAFVYPDAWPTHLSWAALMLYLAGRGAGVASLDRGLGLR